MKKRILSFLLATMMVLTTLVVLPISVSAAGTMSSPYTYEFEDLDARNIADGQVFDVAAFGEAATEPDVTDGIISEGEYTISGTYNHAEQGAYKNSDPTIPVSFAVKGKYLYIAFTAPASAIGNDRVAIQYDIGVSNNHKSYKAYDRVKAQIYADGETIKEGGYFFGSPNLSGYIYTTVEDSTAEGFLQDEYNFWKGKKSLDPTVLLVDAGFNKDAGTYEAKFDLSYYYQFFLTTPEGKDVYQHPIVTASVWYDVLATSPTHYCYKPTTANIDCLRSVGWVPATIIIPDSSLFAIKNSIGKLGYDYRNGVAGQMAELTTYASTLPDVTDGVVVPTEYQIQNHLIDSSVTKHAVGDIYANYSVGNDGYLYAGFYYTLAESASAPSKWLFQSGLEFNSSMVVYSRISGTATTSGISASVGKPSVVPADLLDISAGTWGDSVSWGGATPSNPFSGKMAYNETTRVVSLEAKICIATLAEYLALGNWEPEAANCVKFIMWPAGNTGEGQVAYAAPSTVRGTESTTYGPAVCYPTVKLPDGCVEKFKVDNWDDLGAYGQVNLEAGPSTATTDGKIGASEYTASYSYTAADIIADSGKQKTLTECGIEATNYFTADAENVYIAAKVYDPNFVVGTHGYQIDVAVRTIGDKVDYGQAITRMSWNLKLNADGKTLAATDPGGVYRAQEDTSDGTQNGRPQSDALQNAMLTRISEKKSTFVAAASYDSTSKIAVYEVCIPKSALSYIFYGNETTDIDQIGYYNYHYSVAGWYYLSRNYTDANIKQLLKMMTFRDNEDILYDTETSAWTSIYEPEYYPCMINFTKDYQTKGGASARLSSATPENSGLRFKTTYTDEYIAQMTALAAAYGEELEIGTLIAPASYVEAAGAFTHAALANKYAVNPYVEVKAVVDNPFSAENGTTTYAGSLIGISNVEMEFAGIGYVKIGDNYFYSETYCVRSIKTVASAALADTNKTYTPMQTTILNALVNGTSLDQVN